MPILRVSISLLLGSPQSFVLPRIFKGAFQWLMWHRWLKLTPVARLTYFDRKYRGSDGGSNSTSMIPDTCNQVSFLFSSPSIHQARRLGKRESHISFVPDSDASTRCQGSAEKCGKDVMIWKEMLLPPAYSFDMLGPTPGNEATGCRELCANLCIGAFQDAGLDQH